MEKLQLKPEDVIFFELEKIENEYIVYLIKNLINYQIIKISIPINKKKMKFDDKNEDDGDNNNIVPFIIFKK